jgi:hypothetical protein
VIRPYIGQMAILILAAFEVFNGSSFYLSRSPVRGSEEKRTCLCTISEYALMHRAVGSSDSFVSCVIMNR